MFDNLSR